MLGPLEWGQTQNEERGPDSPASLQQANNGKHNRRHNMKNIYEVPKYRTSNNLSTAEKVLIGKLLVDLKYNGKLHPEDRAMLGILLKKNVA